MTGVSSVRRQPAVTEAFVPDATLALQPGLAVDLAAGAVRVAGLSLLAVVVAAVVAAGYRWTVADSVPRGIATLAGLSAVALALNTTAAFGQVLAGADGPLALAAVGFNGAAFVAAGLLAPVGRLLGDRAAVGLAAVTGAVEVDAEVGRLVRAVGRVVVVTLPEHAREIGDVEGYEPVARETKAELAGRTFLFPRRLRVGDLQDRLATRLRDDYGVGVADVTVDPDGTVTHLAVGRGPVGLGQTLPPETAAVAVRADPGNAAGPGDLVQVWTTAATTPSDEEDATDAPGAERDAAAGSDVAATGDGDATGDTAAPERVTTAEVRATAGDVVTLAVDETVAPRLAGGRFRLVTLPHDPPADRAFVALAGAADATLTSLVVGDVAVTPADCPARVLAVFTDGDATLPPFADDPLAPGDRVIVWGSPAAIRETAGLLEKGEE